LFTLFAGEVFVVDQQAEAFDEREFIVGADLLLLGFQCGGHAAELEVAQLDKNVSGHDILLWVVG
jgi:hypothetical protein